MFGKKVLISNFAARVIFGALLLGLVLFTYTSCWSEPRPRKNMVVDRITSRDYAGKGIESVVIKNKYHLSIIVKPEQFKNNQITSVTFSEKIAEGVSIDFSAFANNQITSITFPEKVERLHIEFNAFANNRITSITFPKTTTASTPFIGLYIDDNAFKNNQITNISFPETANAIRIRENAFANNKITSISFPKDIKKIYIEDNAFANNQIASVSYSEDTEISIAETAFDGNTAPKITFPDRVLVKDDNDGKYYFASIKLPTDSKITSIGYRQYSGNKLSALTIPKNIKILYAEAFANNELETVELQEGLETIEERAFTGNKLTTVRIPQSVKRIEIGAFDPEVVLTGKAVTLSTPIKYVSFSAGSSIIKNLSITDAQGKQVQLSRRGLTPGVYTISATITNKIKLGKLDRNGNEMAEYNISESRSVKKELKEGYRYSLEAWAEPNKDDLKDLEFQAARLGNSVYSSKSIRFDIGMNVKEERISTQ
jgi:hypothetical protein